MLDHPITRCRRCHRPLRAAASVAEQIGRTCKAKARAEARAAARTRYASKPHLLAKAEELIELGGIVRLRGRICLTTGSQGATYRSAPPGCNCRAGLLTRPILCHHRIAADLFTAGLTA